jgi:hypothetical protein
MNQQCGAELVCIAQPATVSRERGISEYDQGRDKASCQSLDRNPLKLTRTGEGQERKELPGGHPDEASSAGATP